MIDHQLAAEGRLIVEIDSEGPGGSGTQIVGSYPVRSNRVIADQIATVPAIDSLVYPDGGCVVRFRLEPPPHDPRATWSVEGRVVAPSR